MIPTINILATEIEEVEIPSKTYKIEITDGELDNRLNGYTDGLNAIQQAIYLILSTERYRYPIYSWNYGVELVDLIGKPIPYVMSEIPRRIKEALTQDSRITNVKDFEFEKNGKALHVTFVVETEVGEIPSELEVTV